MNKGERIRAARDAAVLAQHRIALQKILRELRAANVTTAAAEDAIEAAAISIQEYGVDELRAVEDRLLDYSAGALV